MTAAATPTTATTGAIELARMERRQARKERWRLLRRRPGFIVGVFILAVWVICAIGGEALAPYDPYSSEFTPNLRPGGANPFGTDNLGRDVLSRVMVGARDVLIVAPMAAIISVVAGTMLGLMRGVPPRLLRRGRQPRDGGDPLDPARDVRAARADDARIVRSRV